MSPEIERDIERVLILADKPVMTRPIPAAVVLDALPAACEIDQSSCRRVRRFLDRYTDTLGLTDASAEVAANTGSTVSLQNERGMSSDSSWKASAHAYWQPSAYAFVSLGGVAYDDEAVASGSLLSLGFEYAQLDIGYREHWLSPFTQQAMLISTQAQTLPSITLSNYSPITRMGLRYEVFLAEMDHSDRIRFGNGFTAGRPRLAGTHLSIEPARGWSLGASRIMQFGGGARGGSSFRDFLEALYDPQEADATLGTSRDNEFGNQAAAWTSRFVFPGSIPFAVYLEYAGEDRAYEGNYRFGDASLSVGINVPQLWRRFDLTYEASEWQNNWYVHGIYRDGPTNDGHVLGHWGADARLFGDRIGAQSHMVQLGWEPRFGGLMQFRARTISNDQFATAGPSPVDYERAYDLAVSYSRAINGSTFGAQILAGQDVFGDGFGRFEAFVRLGEDWAIGGAGGLLESVLRPEGAELFVDAGINANRVLITLNAVSATDSGVRTDTDIAPHFGIGARRKASERSDLGVRAEFDQINDELFFALRALDFRYRLTSSLALSAFLGAARYDVATPAFGYYGGFGVQWREIARRLDLNLDARYADKVVRDKILPNDAPRTVRPDSFYDISSISLYLSYRW